MILLTQKMSEWEEEAVLPRRLQAVTMILQVKTIRTRRIELMTMRQNL